MLRPGHILLLALLFACTGCNTDSPPPLAVADVPGQASIIVTRSSDLMYAGAPASVDLNGSRVASLGVGQSYTGPVQPGMVVLTVSAWSAPGQSTFRFNVEAGKSYRLIISPRGQGMLAGMVGGVVGQAAEGGGPFQVTPASL